MRFVSRPADALGFHSLVQTAELAFDLPPFATVRLEEVLLLLEHEPQFQPEFEPKPDPNPNSPLILNLTRTRPKAEPEPKPEPEPEPDP